MSVNGLLISNADFKEFRFFPENLTFPLLSPALRTLISSAFFLLGMIMLASYKWRNLYVF